MPRMAFGDRGPFRQFRDLSRTVGRLQVSSPWTPQPSHLESWVWADLIGDASLMPMTRAEAMSVPPMARARHLIAGTTARLPIRAYRGDDLLPAQPSWIDRTDMPSSPFHRMLWTVDDLLFEGWSLWLLDRGAGGEVLGAERVPFELWDFDEAGLVLIDNAYPRDPRRLCLIPGMHEGILQFARRTIRHASNLVAAADKAAETPTPNLELHQTNDAKMTETQIAALVKRWADARRGKNGGVAYTNQGIELKEHGAHAENLLIEGRNAAAVDIARSCGIPSSMIDANGGGSLTYQTIEGRNREFVDYGLAPYLASISARLGMDDISPRGTRIAFDLEEYLGGIPGTFGAPDDDAELPDVSRSQNAATPTNSGGGI